MALTKGSPRNGPTYGDRAAGLSSHVVGKVDHGLDGTALIARIMRPIPLMRLSIRAVAATPEALPTPVRPFTNAEIPCLEVRRKVQRMWPLSGESVLAHAQ
jgi:hypothetical protein